MWGRGREIEGERVSQEGSTLAGQSAGCFFLIFFNVYLFLRDREKQSTSRGGADREGDTESETGSRL